MSNEEFLDSEDFWKDDFIVKFVQINKDGTEWWQIINPTLKNVVSCNTMLQAFKIAYLAEELLRNDVITTKCNSYAKLKAEWLLYGMDNVTYEDHKRIGDVFYNGKWHIKNKKIL